MRCSTLQHFTLLRYNALLLKIKRLLSKGMSNIYLEVTIEKK